MLKVALGSVLLVTATHGLALSLGGVQGNVIIGRPLDILVQSSMDAAEASSGLCLEADVSYGDVRLPSSAITAAIQSMGNGGRNAVRVRVNQPVNEPIVTVALKAGCPVSLTRNYTLLADFEPPPSALVREPSLATPVALPPLRTTAKVTDKPAPAARAPAAVTQESADSKAAVVAEASAANRTPTPVRLHAPRPRPAGVLRLSSKLKPVVVQTKAEEDKRASSGSVAPQETKAPAGPATPRLKLDPVEVPTSPTGSVAPAGTLEKPLTEPPAQDAPKDAAVAPAVPAASEAAGASATEKELQGLRAEQERMRLTMESINRQLAQAEQDRYNNPLVYGLGALALALAGGVFWLTRRRQPVATSPETQIPWWTVSKNEPTTTALDTESNPVQETPIQPSALSSGAQVDTDVPGLQVSEASESVFLETPIAQIEVGTLVDLWQQVAFFESLGQHEEAASALESFVRHYPRASEAPYLFWLKLADQQGDDKAYAKAQALYEQHFHRLLPTLGAAQTSVGLDADAGFMRQLSSVWPEEDARRLIESALVSQPGDPAGSLQVRSAHSFDDLLVLHGVLELMPDFSTTVQNPEAADDWVTINEIKAAAQAATPPVAPAVIEQPVEQPASSNMLDLHLPDVGSAAPAEVPKPPVVEDKKELPALDFEFHDFDTPPKK